MLQLTKLEKQMYCCNDYVNDSKPTSVLNQQVQSIKVRPGL